MNKNESSSPPVPEPPGPGSFDAPETTVVSVTGLLDQTTVMQSLIASHAEALPTVPTSLAELETLAAAVQVLTRQVERVKVALASRMETDIQVLQAEKLSTTKYTYRSTVERLSEAMHVAPSEVRRWLSVAGAITPVTNSEGEVAVAFPRVKTAFTGGVLNVAEAAKIVKSVGALQAPIKQVTVNAQAAEKMTDRIEKTLVRTAVTGTPHAVERGIKGWEARIDSMGVLPTEEIRQQFQGAFYQGKHLGFHKWMFLVDDLQDEMLRTVMAPELNPNTTNHGTSGDADGTGVAEMVVARDVNGKPVQAPKDKRSIGQKRLDGAMHALMVGLKGGKLSTHGGIQPQVIVNVDHQTLENDLLATDWTYRSDAVHSGPINPRLIRQLACNAELLPVVLGSESQVLDAGSRARLFNPEQRKILYARDRGCTFPGCEKTLDRCQAHHVHEYSRGGVTTIENGVLVCSYHHHVVHETDWEIQMIQGVPYWKPPVSVNPEQPLMRNVFFHAEKPEQLALTL